MASMLRYTTDPIDLQEEIKRLDDHAESIRREKFIAAKKIQSIFNLRGTSVYYSERSNFVGCVQFSSLTISFTFQARIRGLLVRKHLRLLHESAITIQRHWRGYCVRIFADRYLVERVHQMWQDYYDRMATRIQTIWRGYWTRKTVLDIPKMRRWLDTVYAKNYETVEDMKKFRQNEIEHAERVVERESMQWILFMLFKLHHLLRTKQQPGVITRIDRTRFTFIEEMLKCFEFRRYAGRKVTSCGDCQIDPKPSLVFRGTYYERCEREIRELERSLKAGLVPIFRSTMQFAFITNRKQRSRIPG
ncbi:spermatogenesis-associated protein 17-like [Colletes gigas]|uniref:spermatogenesis-associated protein 17-like n=1 Tax=Colletes gigas TaxID=935657 RepID=UPI001C9B82FD|nr:spermatogenesis-associated protein 17-like [Colletes gigas]